MPWSPLTSSNLEAFDYDAEMRVLHLRFRGGRLYSFGDVGKDVAEGLKTASSPGKFFQSNIKDQYRVVW